jgi:hypothetical protein
MNGRSALWIPLFDELADPLRLGAGLARNAHAQVAFS